DLILAEEFAVHHRNAPIAPLADLLGDLEAVAEVAQLAAELQMLCRLEAGEAGRAHGGQHALSDAKLQLLLQLLGIDGEDQDGDAGPSVRGLAGREALLDPGLAAAGDDGG